MIEKSKNQYSSNIIKIAYVKNTKANTKALDKALQKHHTKHSQSTVSIDKQYNNITSKQLNNIDSRKLKFANTLKPFLSIYGKELLNEFYLYWIEPNKSNTKMRFEMQKTWSVELRLRKWASNDKSFNPKKEVKTYNPRG